jgi:hypothetical protein
MKSEPFDEKNLFVCFSKRKALVKIISLSNFEKPLPIFEQ